MALLEDILVLNGWGGPVLLGLGAVMAIPVLLPVVGAVVRPVAKLVHGGLLVTDTLQTLVAEGEEQVEDLIAEAKAEYTTGNGAAA